MTTTPKTVKTRAPRKPKVTPIHDLGFGFTEDRKRPITMADLLRELTGAIAKNPDILDCEIVVQSDAEGNQMHKFFGIGFEVTGGRKWATIVPSDYESELQAISDAELEGLSKEELLAIINS